MTPCLTAKAFFFCMFSRKTRLFLHCQISANFCTNMSCSNWVILSGNVLWVLMSTLLSAACHLVAMICIVTPWFISIDRIRTDKLFWCSYWQFIQNKQTNNSIQRIYYILECLDWTRLAFRVLLLCVNVCTQKKYKMFMSHMSKLRLKSRFMSLCTTSGKSPSHKFEFLCLTNLN